MYNVYDVLKHLFLSKTKAVTKELTNGLEIAANIDAKGNGNAKESKQSSGTNVNWSSVIYRCSKLYPELFSPATEKTRYVERSAIYSIFYLN